MKAGHKLLLASLVVSFYNIGTIWLVQVVCYPLWGYVGPGEFTVYHEVWWHRIWGVILGPAALSLIAAIAMIKVRPPNVPGWAVWLGIALHLAAIIGTAIWWGPWQGELLATAGPIYGPLFHKLVATHWIRLALYTGYGILQLWMASVSFGQVARDAAGKEGSQSLDNAAWQR